MAASSIKYTPNCISAASSEYWMSQEAFKRHTHKLLDDALEKYGSTEFQSATVNATDDAWEEYMELKRKQRYTKIKHAIVPYHIEDNLQYAIYHYNICAFNQRIDPQRIAERSWTFTGNFPTIRTEFNTKWLKKFKA